MTTPYEHDISVADGQRDATLRGLIDEPVRVCTTATLAPSQRATIDRAVYRRLADTTAPRHRAPAHRRRSLTGTRRRLVALVAALLLALSSIAGYLHLQSPTPVSAQTILRRAAAA